MPAEKSVRREYALRRTALTLCPLCCLHGPIARVREHLTTEHDLEQASGWNLSIPARFQAPLLALREQYGLSVGLIVAAALDAHLARLGLAARDSS